MLPPRTCFPHLFTGRRLQQLLGSVAKFEALEGSLNGSAALESTSTSPGTGESFPLACILFQHLNPVRLSHVLPLSLTVLNGIKVFRPFIGPAAGGMGPGMSSLSVDRGG